MPATSLPAGPELGTVRIGDILLTFRSKDGGGRHYLNRTHVEEYFSPFYSIIKSALDPEVCNDVGANYGYTGLLMRRTFPDSRLTLVEPIPWLKEFIQYNFERNAKQFDKFFSAVVSSATSGRQSTFGVNEISTQDSRVVAQPGWTVIDTAVVTLDMLALGTRSEQGVYIKIDTQGWEEHVFAGGESFLEGHNRWFIKTEFAPMWLESQGSDPIQLLRYLLKRYSVHESVGRLRWNCATFAEAIGAPLKIGCQEEFVSYVRNLGSRGTGWVDLYVIPPNGRRGYGLLPDCS